MVRVQGLSTSWLRLVVAGALLALVEPALAQPQEEEPEETGSRSPDDVGRTRGLPLEGEEEREEQEEGEGEEKEEGDLGEEEGEGEGELRIDSAEGESVEQPGGNEPPAAPAPPPAPASGAHAPPDGGAAEDSAGLWLSGGATMLIPVGDTETFARVSGGGRVQAAFRIFTDLAVSLSFEYTLATKQEVLDREDDLSLFGIDAGLRYRRAISERVAFYGEGMVGRHFVRLAQRGNVSSKSGFGARLGMGSTIALAGPLYLEPQASYSTARIPEGALAEAVNLDAFLVELRLGYGF